MKGIVFTEFLEMAEALHAPEVVEGVIDDAALPHGGAYTAVGTYPAGEMLRLLHAYGRRTGESARDTLLRFGQHLYASFERQYPDFFRQMTGPIDLLESVDRHIHVEVRKLYPDAELPTFDCHRPTPDSLVMVYQSRRGLADLADGLIRACLAAWQSPLEVHREELPGPAGTHVRFTLRPP